MSKKKKKRRKSTFVARVVNKNGKEKNLPISKRAERLHRMVSKFEAKGAEIPRMRFNVEMPGRQELRELLGNDDSMAYKTR